MSLGPPFDASGLRQQQAVGAVVVLALVAAVAWVLLLSGRRFGAGVTFDIEMTNPGLLRAGGKVRIAGREVGEIRTVRSAPRGVVLEAFVERAWAREVHVNSELFVATPSILGEAYLEVGPPAAGAPPGPPIVDGAHVRGVDPPRIDNFFAHTEANLRVILALLRDERPAIDELLVAGDGLLATLGGLPADRGQLGRIRDQFVAALEAGRALSAALGGAGGVGRVRQIAAELRVIAERAAPELRALGLRLDTAGARVDALRDLFTDERRAQLAGAIGSLRRAATLGEAAARDLERLAADVARGRGAIGAFLEDRELFDDLHETHRILKSQPWTLILKPIEKR
jgi:ABC-type transporter Mla subunit MlaD